MRRTNIKKNLTSSDLENGLNAVGGNNKFQFYIIFSFIFLKVVTDSFYCTLPYFLTDPKIICLDEKTSLYSVPCHLRDVCKINSDSGDKIKYKLKDENNNNVKLTFINDFSLMCDEVKIGLLASTASVGNLLSNIISPMLTDNLGRIKSIQITLIIDIAIKVLLFYSNDLNYVMMILIIINLTNNLVYTAASLYINEMVSSEKRGTYSCWFNGFYGISGIAYTVIFSITNSWRYLHGFTVLASVISFILVFLLLEESIRFYFMTGDNELIWRSLDKISKINNREEIYHSWKESLPNEEGATVFGSNYNSNLSTAYSDSGQKSQSCCSNNNITKIFTNKDNLFNFISFSIISLVTISGIIYNAVDMKYTEVVPLFPIIFYSVDFIIIVLCGYVIDSPSFGRKIPSLFFSILCSAFYMVKYFIHSNKISSNSVFIVDFIIRCSVSISFNILIEYNFEIYPTDIRSTAFNLNKLFSRLGDFITPIGMSTNHGRMTLIIAVMYFVMSIFIFYLRETQGEVLKENSGKKNDVDIVHKEK
jgi:MFS family permease